MLLLLLNRILLNFFQCHLSIYRAIETSSVSNYPFYNTTKMFLILWQLMKSSDEM